MATQLAETGADGAADLNDNAVDFEAEARKMGWSPKEDFKGDPAKHVDAETFYNRGQEMMPILRAQNKALLKRLDALEKDRVRSAEFFSKAEERAYERAVADIKADMADAVESGDTKAANEALDKLAKLDKPAAPKAGENDAEQRAEEFADWLKANRWFNDTAFQAYANAQADKIVLEKGGKPLDREDLDEVAARVRAKFEDAFPDAFGVKPQKQARNAVDGGGSAPPRRGGRTFADLPPEAQRIADKWVANGVIKSRDDYVKSYPWDDKK